MDPNHDGAPSGRSTIPQALWRHRWLVVTCLILGMLLGLAIAQVQPVRYESSVDLLITDPRGAGVFQEIAPASPDATRFIRNQAQRIQSSTVATRAAELLDGDVSPVEILDLVEAQPSAEFDLIQVRVTWTTAQGAASMAAAVVQAYEDVVVEEVRAAAAAAADELQDARRDLERRIAQADRMLDVDPGAVSMEIERETLASQLSSVQGLIERLTIDTALYGSGVEIIEPPEVPAEPVSPRPVVNAVLGGLIGLLGGGALAMWRSQVAGRVEGRHDAAAILQAPLLGDVPHMGAVGLDGARPTLDAPRSAEAEAFRFIATALEYVLAESGAVSLLVTSPTPGDGKTTTTLNLAVALSQEGRRLALVDADARVAGLTKMAGMEGQIGLTDLVQMGSDATSALQHWMLSDDVRLRMAPVGIRKVDATEFFRTSEYRHLVDRLHADYDLVLLDAPPILAVSETSAAAAAVDGIVLVVPRGTPVRVLEEVRDRLQFVGTPVLGYIFNKAAPRGAGYGAYGYGYVEQPGTSGRGGRPRRGAASRRGAQDRSYPRRTSGKPRQEGWPTTPSGSADPQVRPSSRDS